MCVAAEAVTTHQRPYVCFTHVFSALRPPHVAIQEASWVEVTLVPSFFANSRPCMHKSFILTRFKAIPLMVSIFASTLMNVSVRLNARIRIRH